MKTQKEHYGETDSQLCGFDETETSSTKTSLYGEDIPCKIMEQSGDTKPWIGREPINEWLAVKQQQNGNWNKDYEKDQPLSSAVERA